MAVNMNINQSRKSEEGSIMIILIIILFFLSIAGIFIMQSSLLDYQSTHMSLFSGKEQSEQIADHGVTMLLNAIQEYYLKGKDLDNQTKDGIRIEAQIPYKEESPAIISEPLKKYWQLLFPFEGTEPQNQEQLDIQYDTTHSTFDVEYILKKRTQNQGFDSAIYEMTPMDTSIFEKMAPSFQIPFEQKGQVDISGTYDPIFETLDFYMLSYDNEKNQKKLILSSYKPFIDHAPQVEKEISIKNLYQKKSMGITVESLDWEDDIAIQTIFDTQYKDLTIYMAIGRRKLGEIDLFSFSPYGAREFEYIATQKVNHAAPPDRDGRVFKKMDVSGLMNQNTNTIQLYLTVLFSDRIESYQTEPLLAINNEPAAFWDKKSSLDIGDAVTMDTSAVWNELFNTAYLFLSVNVDRKKIAYYSYLPTAQEEWQLEEELLLITDQGENAFKADQIAFGSYYNAAMNTIRMISVVGNIQNKDLTLYSLDYGMGNWEKQQTWVVQNKEEIGRVSVSGVYGAFDKVLLINAAPIVRKTRIEYKPPEAIWNIQAKSIRNDHPIARTRLKTNFIFEYTEPEIGTQKSEDVQRQIEKIHVLDSIKDTIKTP